MKKSLESCFGNFQDFFCLRFANQFFALNRLRIKNYAQMSEQEADEIWRERLAEVGKTINDEERYREESGGKLYSAAAMYKNPRNNIGDFYDFVKENPNNKQSYMVFLSNDGLPLDILSDTIKHDNKGHNLSKDDWNDVLSHIDNIEDAVLSVRPTNYGSRSYLLKIAGENRKYGVAIAYRNGSNLVTTIFKTTDKGFEQWANKKTAKEPAPYLQAGSSSKQAGNVTLGLSINDIIDILKTNVNKNDVRYKEDNKLYSEKFGSYDPSTKIVELMAGRNPSTLTHELSHHFFISHIGLMEEMGLNDRNKPIFDWLSKKGGHEINSLADIQKQDWENMTEAFIEYMNTGEAPNLVTKSLFQRAKEWLLDNYNIHRTEASTEIRDYFDSLIAKDTEMPDVSKLKDNLG